MMDRNQWGGFTLLEILIATFIFTIVSVIIAGGLRSMLNVQSVVNKKSDILAERQTAFLLISRDCAQAINRPVTNAKGISEEALIGEPENMTLTSAGFVNPLALSPQSALRRLTYLIKDNQLIRSTSPVLDAVSTSLFTDRVLLRGVTALRLEYLDHRHVFQAHWPPQNDVVEKALLPLAIRLTLTLGDEGSVSQLYLLPGKTPDAAQ